MTDTPKRPRINAGGRRRSIDALGLTRQHHEFIRLYLEHGRSHVGPCFKKAFNSTLSKPSTLTQRGNAILAMPGVKAALDALEAASAEHLATAIEGAGVHYAITKSNIMEKLSHLAFSDLRAYFSWGPDGVIIKHSTALTDAQAFAVIEVEERSSRQGKLIRIKVADKRRALTDLAKVAGLLAEAIPDKPTDAPDLVAARRETRQKFLDLLEKLAKPEPLTIEGSQSLDIVVGRNSVGALTRK